MGNISKFPSKAVNKLVGGLKPKQALAKAEKLTTEVLQPTTPSMELSELKQKVHPAVREAMKVISKSKTYGELVSKLDSYTERVMQARNKLLKTFNKPVGGTYLTKLEKEIIKERRAGQMKDSDYNAMVDVLNKERNWFKRQRKMDVIKAQERKEYLQKKADSLLTKVEKGKDVSQDPGRTKAFDILRDSLKSKIELHTPENVKKLNTQYGGLLEAKRLAARQSGLAKKSVEPKFLQKVSELIQGLKGDIPQAVARRAANIQKSIPSVTSKIEKYYNIYKSGEQKNQKILDIINSVSPEIKDKISQLLLSPIIRKSIQKEMRHD